MPCEPSVTSAWPGLRLCTLRSASELLPKSSERPGPKSVSPATYCSGVAVVVCLKWIVDMCAPLLGVCWHAKVADLAFGRARNPPGRPTARGPTVSVAAMSAIRGPAFVGRTTERDVLDGLLATVREGESEALLVHGEAGIGKTALLRYAARQASGFRVAELTGVEAEMELPFAGIHQLCATMLDGINALPVPQRDALSVALGLTDGEVPERFLVGLAVLSLLAAAAEERPLLCLVEDAQWLDGASSQILGLVARRVRAESLAIVIAMREPAAEHDFDGL